MQEPLLETWKSGFGLGIFLGTILISIIEQLWSELWCFKISEKVSLYNVASEAKKVNAKHDQFGEFLINCKYG